MSTMRGVIERYIADLGTLERSDDVPASAARWERLGRFYEDAARRLQAVDFESLDGAGRIDYLLLRGRLRFALKQLGHEQRDFAEVSGILPFARPVVELEAARLHMRPVDPPRCAAVLTEVSTQIAAARERLEGQLKAGEGATDAPSGALPSKVIANRAAWVVDELRRTLAGWNTFYSGYDPEFTWWMRQPYAKADKDLAEYAAFLRNRSAGFAGAGKDEGPVVGDPLGREALLDALEAEMIPYTPEELIAIADREFAWCEGEMRRAARDLGYGDGGWRKALNHVSELHAKPGGQPELIRRLAEEATAFVEGRGLVTVPPLCKETWRMEMMSVERQRVNPFFTGGEVISVSYPTDAMAHDDKVMSLRGNNESFCRATVFHELIPGHHLQLFMADRYNAHRKAFRTPFLIEGWALHWEMLLWDQGFPRSAEDRVGMLFWRAHRAARIIFSLKFHLGQMTAPEAIDFLVERVGHERRNATAEVRRSVSGGYEPLYQAAYMIGGLQVRALRRELVESGRMTDRQFHDAVLRENAIPVELIRAALTGRRLTRDFKPSWRFYDDAPAAGPTTRASRAESPEGPPRRGGPSAPRVYRARVEPHWLSGGGRFWYRNDLPGGEREFVLVDAEAGARRPAFDHARAANALAEATDRPVQAGRLPVESIEFIPPAEGGDGHQSVRLRGRDGTWLLDLATYQLAKGEEAKGEGRDDAGEPQLRVGRVPRPSRRTGAETEVTFVNQADGDVRLFWSDTNGDRQPYGVIKAGERREQHTFAGHVWVVTGADGALLGVFEAGGEPATAVITEANRSRDRGGQGDRLARRRGGALTGGLRSPDGKWEAVVRDHNLWLRDVESKEEHQLTKDGSAEDTYGRDVFRDRAIGAAVEAEPDRPEPAPSRPQAWWSPDSKKLVSMRTHTAPGRTVYLIESSPRDQVQPKLHSLPYLKPGDEIPIPKPHLFDVEAKKEVPVADALFPNPYDLGDVRWAGDSSRFTFLYNQRGHQVLRIVAVDAKSGEPKAIVDEKSETFIDYSGKQFSEYLDDTGEIIWMSERDGWNHLYLYDARTGEVKNQITKGEWVVRGVDRVDRKKRQVWFRAGGIRPGQDPYHVHFCRVNFDGTGLVVLTEGDGTHSLEFSPDGRFFLDTLSRVDLPPVNDLRRTEDGSLLCKLEEADATELTSAGRTFPERVVAKGRDGVTDIYGIIHRPRDFDPNRKYPVIESIYAGPQDSHVPKAFQPSYRQQELADRGFVVVQIDGMGTSNRSKKFHDVCWKNLADAGFPDRIRWMKAAAETRPWMDLTRVGIYGGSAGGQNALGGLFTHGEFYKVAVADSGCHDNRMDKIWWNEQWMGWPVGKEYAENSNVTLAPRLRGKLLLIAGELDRNVDPASTMQVVNALIKADKDFDLLIVPGAGHGAGGGGYGWRRTTDFFVRHLLGEGAGGEPREGQGQALGGEGT